MITFQVKDMTCGHCASTITKSVKATDPNAKITIDVSKQLVMIDPVAADDDELRESIVDAGYSPVAVDNTMVDASAQQGSCCGHCG